MRRLAPLALLALIATGPVAAATCGNDASGFERWKAEFAAEAQAAGIGARGLAALAGASYSTETIRIDRDPRKFRGSLQEFMDRRGSAIIVRQGRQMRAENPAFYDSLERAFGVPAGVIIAIHGMETAFGRNTGNLNVVSSILTVAYDCRRSDFFTPHALAALRMVDAGMMDVSQRGAGHGELGHTQFLPGNALAYGVDANGDGRVDFNNLSDALASTANFLRAKGWQPGRGYLEGQPNFAVLQEWNAAGVYQKAIALMAADIDG